MSSKNLTLWVSFIGVVGVLFGLFYAIFGLKGLPPYQQLVPNNVYTAWSNGLYGSVFIGFSVMLFFVGRYAITMKDDKLMTFLLYGIMSWLIVEAFFSLYFGVYFNIGVDILLAVFLGLPLILGMKSKK